jgi:ATP-dependent Lon protease
MNPIQDIEIEIPSRLPLIPLRDVVIYPYMIFPLLIGRESSMKAVEEAMVGEKMIFVVAQRNPSEEEPDRKDLYSHGTVAKILQILKLPNNVIKVLVEGVARARIIKVRTQKSVKMVEIRVIHPELNVTPQVEATARVAINLFRKYVTLNPNLPDEILSNIEQVNRPGVLVDFIAAHIIQGVEQKQPILEAEGIEDQFEALTKLLEGENEILELERNIENQVRDRITKTQRNFYLQEQIRVIQKELGEEFEDESGDYAKYRAKLDAEKFPEEVVLKVEEELEKLRMTPGMSPEGTVIRNYLDWVFALPWHKRTRDNLDIANAERILDEDHYGLEKAKERILEHLAVLKLVRKLKGQIICLVGPPGVGKTSLGRSIARALKREFVRFSLGGVRDEAEIRGHRRTYIGAMPGRMLQSMKRAGSRNPVILLDEIDKMAMDFRGDPASALLEVLDPQQNNTFRDHYLDLDFDLSEVMFITTANVAENIPYALYDRMEVIHLPGYLLHEKKQIARQFLIPRNLVAHGLKPDDLDISDSGVESIVTQYTMEAGVRNLERKLAQLCRKVARKKVSGQAEGKVRITDKVVPKWLGVPDIQEKHVPEKPMLGSAIGLAWTPFGGDILTIEVGIHGGKGGQLNLTGQLGDVMKESAMAALTWLRTNSAVYKVPAHWFEKNSVHIHIPEGAIPKDGPSAGITMATALASAITGRRVRNDLAMTGELTLRGEVLAIGGLKEKAMAAIRAGVTTVLIPRANLKDLEEMHKEITKRLVFIPVGDMSEVIEHALLPKARVRATPKPSGRAAARTAAPR